MNWKEQAQAVIHALLKEFNGSTATELRRLLNQHYPFGQRKHHPYKVWCSEVNNAIAFKFGTHPNPKKQHSHPNQQSLF